MRPLRHSYTNRTAGDGATVVKRYRGPGAVARSRRERAVLGALAGRLPVPAVLDAQDGRLTMAFLPGIHGQELLETDLAGDVLRACGSMLARIHRIGPGEIAALPGPAGEGHVLVHGDYGPNNVLLDPAATAVTAVLDWEWAHAGDRAEDLAWCEWIVRMHHPDAIDALDELFTAAQQRPPWPARHQAMVDRVSALVALCEATGTPSPWPEWLDATAAWTE